MVSKQREEHPSFPRDKDYLRNADMEKGTAQVYLWMCLFIYPQFHRKTRDDEQGMKCLRIHLLNSADNL